jgi:hypothetical protein
MNQSLENKTKNIKELPFDIQLCLLKEIMNTININYPNLQQINIQIK